jgi:hypothetical protein
MAVTIALHHRKNANASFRAACGGLRRIQVRADGAQIMLKSLRADFSPNGTPYDFRCLCHCPIQQVLFDRSLDNNEDSPNPLRTKWPLPWVRAG